MRLLVCALGFLALSGCTHGGFWWHHPHHLHVYRPDVEESSRVCDVDSLATQRQAYVERAERLRAVSGHETTITDMNKINAFEASIDAQYRAMTASCRAYIQCMEMHAYANGACVTSQQQWSDSQKRFVDLAVDLKKIEASMHHHFHHHHGSYYSPSLLGGFQAGREGR